MGLTSVVNAFAQSDWTSLTSPVTEIVLDGAWMKFRHEILTVFATTEYVDGLGSVFGAANVMGFSTDRCLGWNGNGCARLSLWCTLA